MTSPSVSVIQTDQLAHHLERSRLLAALPWVRHGVTRRVPGMGLADGNVGYTAPRDEADAWDMRQQWASAMGIQPENLVRVRQVHGNDVRIATARDTERGTHPSAPQAPTADALVTGTPDVALMTLHADCLAMFLADPVNRVVAAVHAGWRSTVLNVAARTVDSMRESFGSRPDDLLVYVGPSIGAARYEVGDEVIAAWRDLPGSTDDAYSRQHGRWTFDLKAANVSQLVGSGIDATRIEVSDICTASDPERWFSHRGQGPLTGRFAAIIAIARDGR